MGSGVARARSRAGARQGKRRDGSRVVARHSARGLSNPHDQGGAHRSSRERNRSAQRRPSRESSTKRSIRSPARSKKRNASGSPASGPFRCEGAKLARFQSAHQLTDDDSRRAQRWISRRTRAQEGIVRPAAAHAGLDSPGPEPKLACTERITMSTEGFDADRFKREQRQTWDAAAPGWEKWWDTVRACGAVGEQSPGRAGEDQTRRSRARYRDRNRRAGDHRGARGRPNRAA